MESRHPGIIVEKFQLRNRPPEIIVKDFTRQKTKEESK